MNKLNKLKILNKPRDERKVFKFNIVKYSINKGFEVKLNKLLTKIINKLREEGKFNKTLSQNTQ